MSTEAIVDSDIRPTAMVVGTPEDLSPLEINPPERHLGGVAVERQVETVRDLQTENDEYSLPTLRDEGLLHRVRTEMRKRRVRGQLLSRHVQRHL